MRVIPQDITDVERAAELADGEAQYYREIVDAPAEVSDLEALAERLRLMAKRLQGQ